MTGKSLSLFKNKYYNTFSSSKLVLHWRSTRIKYFVSYFKKSIVTYNICFVFTHQYMSSSYWTRVKLFDIFKHISIKLIFLLDRWNDISYWNFANTSKYIEFEPNHYTWPNNINIFEWIRISGPKVLIYNDKYFIRFFLFVVFAPYIAII
jgi:hypothetical protein